MTRITSLLMSFLLLVCAAIIPVTASAETLYKAEYIPIQQYHVMEENLDGYATETGWYYYTPSINVGDAIVVYYTADEAETFTLSEEESAFVNEKGDVLEVAVEDIGEQSVGNTEFNVELIDYHYTISVPVEIYENPVSSIDYLPAEPFTLIEDYSAGYVENGKRYYFSPSLHYGDILTVTMKSGDKIEYTYQYGGFTDSEGNTLGSYRIEDVGFFSGTGKTSFTVSFDTINKSISLPVEVFENPVASITASPSKVVYSSLITPLVLSPFNMNRGVYDITVKYTDGSTKVLTDISHSTDLDDGTLIINQNGVTKVGANEVTISYMGRQTTSRYTVIDKVSVSAFSVRQTAKVPSGMTWSGFIASGTLELNVQYSDGSKEVIIPKNMVIGADAALYQGNWPIYGKYFSDLYIMTPYDYEVPDQPYDGDAVRFKLGEKEFTLVLSSEAESHKHEYALNKTVQATCVKDGYRYYKCKSCAKNYTETVKATGVHTPVTDKAVAATYFADGKTAGSHCSVCKKVLTVQKKIAKKKLTAPTIAIKGKAKSLLVSWKKVKDATGYEIQYSTSKKFNKKSTKTVKVKKAKTVKKTVKALKAKKKYYVRVRAYKTAGKQTAYSPYSKTVAAKTK